MTVNATLERGNTTISLPLIEEGANILTSVDFGKPDLITHNEGGSPFPIIQDQWSGNATYNLIGKFIGDSAHSDAIELVDFILQDGNGEPITLNISALGELDADIKCVPAAGQGNALNLNYEPGKKNVVEYDLGLTRVNEVLGEYDRTITTPTASGSGPIQLTDGTTTVDLETDVQVERTVGRPNDVVRRSQEDFPNYFPKPKTLNDQFDLNLYFTDSATGKTSDLASLFRQKTGRSGLTLDFNGLFGYGAFNVAPVPSQSLRHVRDAGKKGVTIIPTVSLQRITTV